MSEVEGEAWSLPGGPCEAGPHWPWKSICTLSKEEQEALKDLKQESDMISYALWLGGCVIED